MVSRFRSAALAGVSTLLFCSVVGCSSSSALKSRTAAQAPAPAKPEAESAPSPAQTAASEHFYKGKALALAGDSDCARIEFDQALETFREGTRPGHSEDLAFADQLYESVKLYRGVTDRKPEEDARPPVENQHDSLIAAAPTAKNPSAEEVEKAKHEIALDGSADSFDIPMVVNDRVLKAVAFFQFRIPQLFAGALQRSGRYMPLMREILKEQGLPQDLVFVAMIESAFKSRAHSRAAAHGFWQFIDGTGRRYGLHQTRYFDERSDPVKSTYAAARYFKDLYEMFGDWHLAMAAYDAGEGKIIRGLQRTGARDYWELASGSHLHQETRDYVPFVLAAALITRNPKRFGFDVVPDSPLAYDLVNVSRPVDLRKIAEAAGTTLDEIQNLNGELKTRATPRGFADYPLRVPVGTGELLAARLGSLPTAPDVEERQVRAKKGDTVARVAARYHVSVADLCEWNDITRNTRLKKGTVLVVASRETGAPKLGRVAPQVAAQSQTPARPAYGEIRALPTPGSAITSAAQLGTISSAPMPQPSAGDPLPSRVDIPREGFVMEPAKAATVAKAEPVPSSRKIVHTVKPGETLYRIATKYGLSVDAIRRQNRLGKRSLLAAGQRLTLSIASVH